MRVGHTRVRRTYRRRPFRYLQKEREKRGRGGGEEGEWRGVRG